MGDYPGRPPCSWMEGILTSLWDFSFTLWTYRNTTKHGATLAEQTSIWRARIVALVTDRYYHCPHLDIKYNWLFKKPLATLLQQGNCALYVWLGSVNNFASLSSVYKRLSDAAIGRLRRPIR